LSIAANLGLPNLVAATKERLVDDACALSRDTSHLAELRRGLRQRMQESPLMNAAGFTRDLESAYRSMWRQWCETGEREP
jgi:predicted O-linked N-acetylglucosamine transferase (SPINDLY family)